MYKIESNFDYKGYKLVVIFTDLGHRCGYIGIKKGNSLYGKDVMREEISVPHIHGGITFSEFTDTYPLRKKTVLYWIGFDTAHLGDCADFVSAERYNIKLPYNRKEPFFKNDTPKSIKFCKLELIRFVDELVSYSQKKK